jgi:hypothetical protein
VEQNSQQQSPEQLATSFELWAEYFRHLASVSYTGLAGLIALTQIVPREGWDELGVAGIAFVCAAVVALAGNEKTLEQIDRWEPLPKTVRRLKDWSQALIFVGIIAAGVGAMP